MNLFGFKKPTPTQPSLEEKLSQALAETETSTSPANADSNNAEIEPASASNTEIEIEAKTSIETDATNFLTSSDVDASTEKFSEPMELTSGPEPLRALFPGSFLGGQYEIKEVISRGAINYYLADAGDYGAHDWKLIGERVTVKSAPENGPLDAFFPPATRFLQDEREYGAWDFETLQPLEEWNAPPNDETYFAVMGNLARAFAALENAGLHPDLPPISLFFDGGGHLRCFGFFDAKIAALDIAESENEESEITASENAGLEAVETLVAPSMSATQQLSALSSRFAKTNLAAGATLRLDDEFGALPFSEEVKNFAQKLSEGEFERADDVVEALEPLARFQKTEVALLSDVGMERELNEDCGLIWKSRRAGHARNFEIEVLAVADGMGGHEGGEVASDLALSALESAISRRQNLNFADNSVILKAMSEILLEVNDAVVRLTENPPYASMRAKPGATLVCALRVGPRVFIGNVGDSRAYRWNLYSGLQRLTRDHSYVQDLLDSGSISENEAWGHPDGSVITSHIGMMRGMKKDAFLRYLSAGDRLILVSDGVVDTLRDAHIESIVAQNGEAEALCAALVNASNDAGGFDNITVAALICT